MIWFLDYMFEDPKNHVKQQLLKASVKPDFLERIKKITLKYGKRGVEGPAQTSQRIQKFVDQIREFISQKAKSVVNVADDEILVVSHGRYLAMLLKMIELGPNDTYGKWSAPWKTEI